MALKILPFVLPLAVAFECTTSAFQALLPSTATVISACHLPDNSTFEVPASNIAYPVSPTQLRALCVVHINVTSSSTSAYQFGLFLPDDWNDRFLAVGNGGFAGGVNWLDMVCFNPTASSRKVQRLSHKGQRLHAECNVFHAAIFTQPSSSRKVQRLCAPKWNRLKSGEVVSAPWSRPKWLLALLD